MSNGWGELVRRALDAELTPDRAARRHMGDAVRRLIERLMSRAIPADALNEAAVAVEQLSARLAEYEGRRDLDGFGESAIAGTPTALFDHSPEVGQGNPLAPPLVLTIDGDTVTGRACFNAAYEGAPGCVHGGHVAAALDEVLGMANAMNGVPGMTGTLTVRYVRPTPLYTDLRFEGRVDRIDGRKIFTSGRVLDGEEVTAEADAVFITVDFERIAALYDKRKQPGD
ncbi:MAG TPA: PaaI family thioesterase [Acidimicrobiales bacterium]|nr:PaaI family thioesterase [Acidimicrobiales bacterium]